MFSRFYFHYFLGFLTLFLSAATFVSADNLCKEFVPRLLPIETSILIWIQTVCHSDSVPERCFEKVNFEKKSQQMTTKVLKSSSVQRALHFGLLKLFTFV